MVLTGKLPIVRDGELDCLIHLDLYTFADDVAG